MPVLKAKSMPNFSGRTIFSVLPPGTLYLRYAFCIYHHHLSPNVFILFTA
ncbi:hypothetical protein CLOBOL_06951 [Enterocloster bolteae ATCC BAA-613]|uniref:Uncharacterized protein n=1 Tax=Enterocloster bolteae (strain ATCC BAA-613 / DSM 15670 / CCUG 46953 / JCM 12243 / WAL 16351) TaxID=411902 RepID=A8S523_ENTBW|nr:hypothetical protein CLOBOL_06951 [Enterocloster bolteae ATCC BAA-613]